MKAPAIGGHREHPTVMGFKRSPLYKGLLPPCCRLQGVSRKQFAINIGCTRGHRLPRWPIRRGRDPEKTGRDSVNPTKKKAPARKRLTNRRVIFYRQSDCLMFAGRRSDTALLATRPVAGRLCFDLIDTGKCPRRVPLSRPGPRRFHCRESICPCPINKTAPDWDARPNFRNRAVRSL